MIRHSRSKSQMGFTLIELLITMGLTVFTALTMAQLFVSQTKQTRALSQKFEINDFKQMMLLTLADSQTCSCQLDRNINTAHSSDLVVDTTKSKIPDVNLGVFRSGCDMSSSDNVLAQAGQDLRNSQAGLKVSAVKLTQIRKVSDPSVYSATLSIELDSSDGRFPFKPIESLVRFNLDTTTGSPSARRIQSCGTISNPKVYSGTETVGFYNGQPESTRATVAFPDPNCSNPKVFVNSRTESIACGNGLMPTSCTSYSSTSQDVHGRAIDIDPVSKTFKVYISAMDGVWVGGSSPAYQVDWLLVCE